MKTSRSHSAAPHADRAAKEEHTKRRSLDGSYGVCEQTAKRIPAARLKAVPWTRFREEVEARLESTGAITAPHLGTLRSVRDEPAAALAESRTAGGGTETCLANRTTHRNISSRSRETNLVRRDFFKTKGRPNHHDPASAGDLPKYRRIRGCGGAGPGGSK